MIIITLLYNDMISSFYKRALTFYKRHERKIIPGMLVLGFVVDVVTFRSINIELAFILLGVHLLVVAGAVGFITIYDAKDIKFRLFGYFRLIAPLLMQFSFGALLSAAFIFYSFGGALSVSWPLILLIFFLMVSNEIFKRSYLYFGVQSSVLFFVMFVFFSLVLPYVFHSLSVLWFVLAGIVSVVIIGVYIYVLSSFSPSLRNRRDKYMWFIAIIFFVMHGLYFLNIIPPVPLSLRDVGVYHDVTRDGNDYKVLEEKETLLDKFLPGKTIHVVSSESLYIFTSIFAPAELNTNIVHDWQWYDDKGKWISMSSPGYRISGGRSDGYRGFTVKGNLQNGRWRVFVKTERGQVLGKVGFRVEFVEEMGEREIGVR